MALRPWLFKIALNVFYGHLRKSRLSVVALDLSEAGPHLALEEDQGLQPDAIFAKEEELRELGSLLDQLPEQYRTVINLFYFADLGYQEIADLLNLPMGTVKSHLHRGIQRLRRILQLSPEKGRGTHVIRKR
jgi:RNA polymerase sigma-70 factor (ECF subfamily)